MILSRLSSLSLFPRVVQHHLLPPAIYMLYIYHIVDPAATTLYYCNFREDRMLQWISAICFSYMDWFLSANPECDVQQNILRNATAVFFYYVLPSSVAGNLGMRYATKCLSAFLVAVRCLPFSYTRILRMRCAANIAFRCSDDRYWTGFSVHILYMNPLEETFTRLFRLILAFSRKLERSRRATNDLSNIHWDETS